MSRRFAQLKLEEIDSRDETFAVKSFTSQEHLHGSLERVGLLHPLWVWEKESARYVVVDGFKRLDWLSRSGVGSVECNIFPESIEEPELWKLRVEQKLFGKELNTAEKAQIIARLARLFPAGDVARNYLPLLSIPPRTEMMDRWRRLADSGVDLLEAAATEQISDKAALELASWGVLSRELGIALLKELRCSSSIQMEILERVKEIAIREDCTKSELLQNTEVQAVLKEPDKNRRQKTQSLRNWLYRRRFPTIYKKEREFRKKLAEANLPPQVVLVPPPAFEGDRWQMVISFSSSEQLQKLLKEIRKLTRSKSLKSLLGGE